MLTFLFTLACVLASAAVIYKFMLLPMEQNAERRLHALEDELMELATKVKTATPRLCSTHDHEMEAVYDVFIEVPEKMDVAMINSLGKAAENNQEELALLLDKMKSSKKTYVKHVCKYCGLVVEREGGKSSAPNFEEE